MASIGGWKEYLPYQGTIDVTASENKIYAATEYSLFSIDVQSNEVTRISKLNGLAETGISAVYFNKLTKQLLVAYRNSNIDIIDAFGIHNIPALKRKVVAGDKKVYNVFADASSFYLCTRLGVVVIDAHKFEVSETWNMGEGGNAVKVNALTQANDLFYAATEQGLKTAHVNDDLANAESWLTNTLDGSVPSGACQGVVTLQNHVMALQNNRVFLEEAGAWRLFFTSDLAVASINVANNKLLVCQRAQNESSAVTVLRFNGTVETVLKKENVIAYPLKAFSVGGSYWVADLYGGLSHWQGGVVETYKLNSPDNVALGALAVYNGVLYAAAGSVNSSWNYQYNPNGLYQLQQGSWRSFNRYHFAALQNVLDVVTVAVDPRNESIWAGSFGSGLIHINTNDEITVYNRNTPLQPPAGDPESYRVAGLAFDINNNLWISNFGASQPLHVLTANGTWHSFAVPFWLNGNALYQIIVDDGGRKWIVAPLGNGLLVFDDNGTTENRTDDRWKLLKAGQGLGNLPSNNVNCVATDQSGFIWVGTANGVGVIECPQQVFLQGCEAMQPVITAGGFANYLFKGENVAAIAVDGADRKWMATANGAWLLNSQGTEMLLHFTAENSGLLANDVKSIAIDNNTGEVFFATAQGICSYRSTATATPDENTQVLVFPNPVPPSYNGSIAIKGVPNFSNIKITEVNGRLVYETTALGGQAIWNGKDHKGRRVATGVYLVLAQTENKAATIVAKIVFIGK